MAYDQFILLYLVMLFLQTIHIFEEIAYKVYDAIGSLNKYLVVASLLVFLSYLPLILISQRIQVGYYLGFFSSVLAFGNGIIHIAGFIKTKSFRGTIGAGVFSGIPLGITGLLVFLQLFSYI